MIKFEHFLEVAGKSEDRAILVTKPENIFYLTGFKESITAETFGFVIVHESKFYLICDGRYIGTAKKLENQSLAVFEYPTDMKKLTQKLPNIVCEYEDSISVAKLRFLKKTFSSFSWKVKVGGFDFLRRAKTEVEIELISQAQTRVDKVLISFLKENLRPGKTEIELKKNLDLVLTDHFKHELSFPTQVSFGENSAIPHHNSGPSALKVGDNVLVDCGIKIDGYCSDVTRNYVFGEPSFEYLDNYKELLQIQCETLKWFKTGEKVSKIDKFCRAQMKDKSKFYTHSLGHGVGLEIHELPRISHRSADKLIESEVVTCEPGYYFPEKFGIRIEDLLVITKSGPRILSQITKDLLSFDEHGNVKILVPVA